MPVRLKDIADDLGVSVVTVSKVLRNHGDISRETRDRVLKRIKELNYQPNLAARALVTGRTHLIGLVVPDLVHQFFAQVAKGASHVLRKRGYSLIISSSEEDPALENEEISQLLSRRIDALIVASSHSTPAFLQQIEDAQIPYLLLDRKFSGCEACFVGIDDRKAGELATTHLIENGCQRIAYIGGKNVSTAINRLEGFRKAMAAHRLPIHEGQITCRSHFDDAADITGYKAMKTLLRRKPHPDGIFCYNDPVATGVMQAIIEAGLRIPEDIALIGCGNVRYASALRVPLSSVDQDCELMGEQAAAIALDLIAGKVVTPKTVLLEPRLIVRKSSVRPAANSNPVSKPNRAVVSK
ncbi:MAG: LacI family DNA-binding transcriptional regulator [Acidobacteriaceae bacterium]|nr:LacI family DNA-binding transcriptional regulator [Acidobacteriaceae bacterium]